jgi:hypothetical protein
VTDSNAKTTYDIKRRSDRPCIRSGLDTAGEQSISPAFQAGVYLEMVVEGNLRAHFPNDSRVPAILTRVGQVFDGGSQPRSPNAPGQMPGIDWILALETQPIVLLGRHWVDGRRLGSIRAGDRL